MKFIDFRSLHVRVIFILSLFLLGFLGYSLFTLKKTEETMLSLEEAKARTLMQSNLSNLADALYFHFDRTAEDILKTILLQNQGIVALRLYSSAP
ncbi:hypothetical protein, partial [Hydrogenimonas sp.]